MDADPKHVKHFTCSGENVSNRTEHIKQEVFEEQTIRGFHIDQIKIEQNEVNLADLQSEIKVENRGCDFYSALTECNELNQRNNVKQEVVDEIANNASKKKRAHKNKETGSNLQLYTCNICDLTFTTEAKLIAHNFIHSSELHCESLVHNLVLSTKEPNDISEVHKKGNTGDGPYACDICKRTYLHKSSLQTHRVLHTNDFYTCEICQKRFHRKRSLEIHSVVHTNEQPYECDICKKRFKYKNHLSVHRSAHINGRCFSCEICNKSFKRKSTLKDHKKVHSEEVPYSCEVCYKSFKFKTNLTAHRKIHTDVHLFSCDICNKTFKLKRNLNIHSKLHSVDSPFSCNVCQKTFKQKRSLDLHVQIHSNDKAFSCELCEKRFNTKNYLSVHIRNMHIRNQQ